MEVTYKITGKEMRVKGQQDHIHLRTFVDICVFTLNIDVQINICVIMAG